MRMVVSATTRLPFAPAEQRILIALFESITIKPAVRAAVVVRRACGYRCQRTRRHRQDDARLDGKGRVIRSTSLVEARLIHNCSQRVRQCGVGQPNGTGGERSDHIGVLFDTATVQIHGKVDSHIAM